VERNLIFLCNNNALFEITLNSYNKCFAYNGVKILGVTDAYECGSIYRIECWLNALEIR